MIAVKTRAVSIALACRTFEISETCYRYERLLSDENAEIADWLERLTANRKTWGFGLCFLYLRNVKGFEWNHKRVYESMYNAMKTQDKKTGSATVKEFCKVRDESGPPPSKFSNMLMEF